MFLLFSSNSISVVRQSLWDNVIQRFPVNLTLLTHTFPAVDTYKLCEKTESEGRAFSTAPIFQVQNMDLKCEP